MQRTRFSVISQIQKLNVVCRPVNIHLFSKEQLALTDLFATVAGRKALIYAFVQLLTTHEWCKKNLTELKITRSRRRYIKQKGSTTGTVLELTLTTKITSLIQGRMTALFLETTILPKLLNPVQLLQQNATNVNV